jgi:hypothetical protein
MQGPQNVSRKKRILFKFMVLAISYGLIELSLLAYLNFSFGYLLANRERITNYDPAGPIGNTYSMMIHPYIGAVYQPHRGSEQRSSGDLHVTEFGFLDERSPLRKREPGKLIVGLIGGSVARQLGMNATDVLERELSQISEFQGKAFEFVHLAIDGQKQPQHLMALNYLLTLGGEFDLLINLDGVNEISLAGIDNVPFGVSAAYPRKWGVLISNTASVSMMRAIGYLTYLRTEQRDCARWFDAVPLRYSPASSLIWKARNARWDRLISEQLEEIDRRSQDDEFVYGRSGPPEDFDSEDQLLAHCADIWARSSVLLQGICHASKIHYFHFLQPNQYLADSKPIGRSQAGIE